MCSPTNQIRIVPRKIESISEMKELCRECPILEKEDNEHFKTSN